MNWNSFKKVFVCPRFAHNMFAIEVQNAIFTLAMKFAIPPDGELPFG